MIQAIGSKQIITAIRIKDNIVTLEKIDRLVSALRESDYNVSKIEFLEKGFKKGFDLGYEAPQGRQSVSNNIPQTVGDKFYIWNKVMKEVKLGRVAGPFSKIDNYIQSPIGLQ